jgi:hypothetical protein
MNRPDAIQEQLVNAGIATLDLCPDCASWYVSDMAGDFDYVMTVFFAKIYSDSGTSFAGLSGFLSG